MEKVDIMHPMDEKFYKMDYLTLIDILRLRDYILSPRIQF